ncbi:MAG: TRAP transporter small permease subunit [Rhizobiales bacterium]|nr:TRAP transporter small permease subunit [Hyphomicrobiales bacterium]
MLRTWGGWIDTTLSYAEIVFIGTAMAFASLLLFVNVILRYAFLAPISWAEELSVYLVIWIVFIGASVVVRMRGHLAIDLVPKMLSPAVRRVLLAWILLINLGFFAIFIYYSALHTLRVFASGQTTPSMEAPMWLTYLAMPVGTTLMFVRTVQLLFGVIFDEEVETVSGPQE